MQVQQHVDDAVSKGAKALTGGSRPDLPAPYDKGNFFQPTVLADCTIDMKVSFHTVHLCMEGCIRQDLLVEHVLAVLIA